jgi:hypothetical protein
MSWIGRHLRNNIVGYLALIIALGGTSYAVTALPRNSVGTPQIKDSAVTTPKIKDRAVTKAKTKPGVVPFTQSRLTGADFADPVGLDPAADPDNKTLFHPLRFSMPFAGRATIGAFIDQFAQSCSSGFAAIGLYVDGEPVTGTHSHVANVLDFSGRGHPAEVMVATIPLGSGPHRADVGVDCPNGNLSSATYGDLAWTVTAAK